MTKLCLSMIVRNEAARIERALASVAPYITAAVILDTGSTDDTKERIRTFFVAHPHIKLWLVDGTFENFSQARNLALTEARFLLSYHHADYFLLMDADMELRVQKPDAFNVYGPAFHMIQVAGGTSYHNTRLLHAHTPGQYVGATHEYLDVPSAGLIDGADFLDHADGSNRTDKFERDIRLLQDDLLKPGNSHNPRTWFYLANSYRDAGNWRQAEIAYKQRIDLGGWDEEVWNAEVNLAACLESQGVESGFVHTALSAYNRRPQRAEALYDLTKHYREKPNSQASALLFCKAGLELKRPDDTLFVADWVYNWGFREEFSILGFYGSEKDKKAAARACNGLGLDLSVPEHVRAGARRNNRWYLRPLAEHCPSFESRVINVTPADGYIPMNPSVANIDGQLWCIVRTVNYTIDGDGRYLIKGDGEPNGSNPINTRNILVDLRSDLTTERETAIHWVGLNRFSLVRGLEDMRLFGWKDDLYAVACAREDLASGTPQQIRVKLHHCELGYHAIGTTYLTDGSACEKNWMPLVDGDDLNYVYRLDTIVAGDVEKLSVERSPVKVAVDNISGGSQCIPFKNGWLCVVHEAIDPGDYRRVYAHRFAWLGPDYTLRRLSMPFCFHAQQIEFCAGLAVHPNGLDLVLSYGVRDAQAMLAQVSSEEVSAMLSDFHAG